MFGMVDTRLRPRLFTILTATFLAIAAFGLALHALADAVCVQPENISFRGCASSPMTAASTGRQFTACAVLHSGCTLPEIASLFVPVALACAAGLVAVQLTPLHFLPPAQPPKHFQTL